MTAYWNPTLTKCAQLFMFLAGSSLSFAQFSVTTYHYDNGRTGWNSHETVLTTSNVNSSTFGVLKTVTLDDQVDSQPLVIPNVTITAWRPSGRPHRRLRGDRREHGLRG